MVNEIDINQHPSITGRQMRENGTPVNVADLIDSLITKALDATNGYLNVSLKTSLSYLFDSIAVFLQADNTANGTCTPYYYISDGSAKNGIVKAAAGRLYALSISNSNATVRYVRLYNKATAPATSDTPIKKYVVPAGSTVIAHLPVFGSYFSTGISWRITTGIADNDDTAASANDINLNIEYI